MLVGDSALATTTELSAELQAANMAGPHHHHLHVASWHAGCSASASGGGSSGPDAPPCPKDAVHLLSSSWDVADAALVREPMQMVQLGGSAPVAPPASLPPPSKHGSGPNLQRLGGSQVSLLWMRVQGCVGMLKLPALALCISSNWAARGLPVPELVS